MEYKDKQIDDLLRVQDSDSEDNDEDDDVIDEAAQEKK